MPGGCLVCCAQVVHRLAGLWITVLISDILYQFCEFWVKFVWVLVQNGANTNVSEAHAKPASRPDLRRAGRAY